jgi:hypothetical protein
MNRFIAIATLAMTAGLLLASTSIVVRADDRPTGSGGGLTQLSGNIDYINVKETKVVINDTTYLVAPNIPVAAFKKGARVAFLVAPPARGQRPMIMQLWPISSNASGEKR